jgi:hypothetical protein
VIPLEDKVFISKNRVLVTSPVGLTYGTAQIVESGEDPCAGHPFKVFEATRLHVDRLRQALDARINIFSFSFNAGGGWEAIIHEPDAERFRLIMMGREPDLPDSLPSVKGN